MFGNKPKHNYVDIFEGILIGGSLVGMATFLFGTAKGKRLQKDLVHQYHKLKHKAAHLHEKMEKTIHKNAPKLKRVIKKMQAEALKTARKAKKVRAKARRAVRKVKRKTGKTHRHKRPSLN